MTATNATPPTSTAYEAQTADERHLASLMEQLPQMQQIQERLERHREARHLCEKFQAVDDLGAALDGLEAQEPLNTPEGQRLYAILLNEKQAAYRDEKRRLDHDVAHSRFSSIVEAHAACMDLAELADLEDRLNRFREDYALTLTKCRGI